MGVLDMLNANRAVVVHRGMPDDESAYAGEDTDPAGNGLQLSHGEMSGHVDCWAEVIENYKI